MEPYDELLAIALPATYGISVAAIVLEAIALRWLGHRSHPRSIRASLMSAAGAFGGIAVANRLFFMALMTALWHWRQVDLGHGLLAWVVAFILYDLMFYVAHRAGHEVRLLWCFHSVHHTTEEMRLTTAIRGSVLDFVYLPWFFVWLPLVGIHPAIVLLVEVFGRLWGVATHVHPRFVGQLGWLDRVLVTPSVHRVHHGRNLRYLDHNYGEVLLLWDRLLGTWTPEQDDPDYGVISKVDEGSFVDIQASPWTDLWRDVQATPRWTDKVRLCILAPGWSPDGPDQRASTLQARPGLCPPGKHP